MSNINIIIVNKYHSLLRNIYVNIFSILPFDLFFNKYSFCLSGFSILIKLDMIHVPIGLSKSILIFISKLLLLYFIMLHELFIVR
jgi:hypothetical protein